MKIHITLVGGQIIPVYKGILFSQPEKIVLIHSSESENDAIHLREIVQNDHVAKNGTELIHINPNNFEGILNQLQLLISTENTYSFNITSGNKLMALAAYQIAMQNENCSIYYIDQTDLFTDLKTKENDSIDQFVNIEKVFELGKNPIASSKKLNITNEILNNIDKIRDIYNNDIAEISELLHHLRESKNFKNLKFTSKMGSTLTLDELDGELNLNISRKNEFITETFEGRRNINLLRLTTWFELYVAHLLNDWSYIEEIKTNIKVKNARGVDKNEIDIILNTGTKLYFIECKTQVSDSKDIEKFTNISKRYGGLAAKTVLITYFKLKDDFFEKTKDAKIKVVALELLDQNHLKKELIQHLEGIFLNDNYK